MIQPISSHRIKAHCKVTACLPPTRQFGSYSPVLTAFHRVIPLPYYRFNAGLVISLFIPVRLVIQLVIQLSRSTISRPWLLPTNHQLVAEIGIEAAERSQHFIEEPDSTIEFANSCLDFHSDEKMLKYDLFNEELIDRLRCVGHSPIAVASLVVTCLC